MSSVNASGAGGVTFNIIGDHSAVTITEASLLALIGDLRSDLPSTARWREEYSNTMNQKRANNQEDDRFDETEGPVKRKKN